MWRFGRTLIVAGCALFGAIGPLAPAHASTCFDKAQLKDYDPALIRAIQQKLLDRKLFSGPISGKVDRPTLVGLSRLTGWPVNSEFRLWSELVQTIFGPNYHGIYEPEDQDRLIEDLGLTPDPGYRNPCLHVKVVGE